MDSSGLLAAVARLVAQGPALAELVPRLATLLRDAVPFERLHVLRLDRAESVILYVARPTGELEVTGHRIADTGAAAAPAAVATGARSRIICTVGDGSSVHGALWFTSEAPDAFTPAHEALVDSVADLLSLALQHDALRSTEAVRRERIDTLDRLLHTMAGALDIRHIFAEVSDVVRDGLPHDVLALTSWAEDGRSLRVYAMTGAQVDDPGFWAPMPVIGDGRALLHRDPYVVRDTNEIEAGTARGSIFRRLGAGSALRVPMALDTGVFGSLFFLAREPDRFSPGDIDFARRVADLLALALSHQRLAEAARRDAAARETAAQLEAQVATLTRELEARTGQRRVVGHSQQWKDVLAQAARVAQTETTVLLTGESGTGKEVVARFIHQGSRRKNGPFVAINCAALPDQLLESELFGHERGAFTGAVAAKPGRIEQANGGVLFLDEIGEMAPAVQAKLLRVLEEREFMRLGGTRSSRADIRVIAATNRDLHAAMSRGGFREDLYYRISVFEIALPALRDRLDDILELADAFLEEIGGTVGKPPAGIAREAKDALLTYPWPGNVRELRNAIERAVILADGGYIRTEHLPLTMPREPAPAPPGAAAPATAAEPSSAPLPPGGVNLDELERSLVARALLQARYNKTRAAKLLGLTRAQLYTRIERYGLTES
ncbi:MAG: sigma 54-interacting transcriptional regulator [Acidobacteria bacterium]|nr:sigma 54-interacting transcriptional regulator [Acidobacteriota bacterium]